MGKKAILLSLLLVCLSEAKGQIFEFSQPSNGTNTIVVPAGERWKIVTYICNGYIEVHANSNRTSLVGYISGGSEEFVGGEGRNYGSLGAILVGPKYIFPVGINRYAFVFQKIQDTSTNSPVSSTSVVIPTASTGDVDVKMEQSADNVTWTECLPGTYNSSTVKRFFRLRAVEK